MKFDAEKLTAPARPRFFPGAPVTTDDLIAEQEYEREKQWLHNRLLHGYGIVVGLEVMIQDDESESAQLVIAPGFALDGWGRELLVPAQLSFVIPHERRDIYVYLKYLEQDDGDPGDKTKAAPRRARVVGGVQVLFEPPPAERAIAPTQRDDFAIPLTRVRRPHLTWQRDRDFRPPRPHS